KLSRQMATSVKTLKEHLPYLKNSLEYTYNNGRIEGINNKIKVLNRVAYGYRNFHNFKNRILLHFKLRTIIKQKYTVCFDLNSYHQRQLTKSHKKRLDKAIPPSPFRERARFFSSNFVFSFYFLHGLITFAPRLLHLILTEHFLS